MFKLYFDILFLGIMTPIIFQTGNICYRNGNTFIEHLSSDQTIITKQINKFLLVGYYLIVIGFTAFTVSFWNEIFNLLDLVELLLKSIGVMVLVLSILHYINILSIYFFFNYKKHGKL